MNTLPERWTIDYIMSNERKVFCRQRDQFIVVNDDDCVDLSIVSSLWRNRSIFSANRYRRTSFHRTHTNVDTQYECLRWLFTSTDCSRCIEVLVKRLSCTYRWIRIRLDVMSITEIINVCSCVHYHREHILVMHSQSSAQNEWRSGRTQLTRNRCIFNDIELNSVDVYV
jgi:hypothetical protein